MLRRLTFLAAFVLGSAALITHAQQANTYLIFSSQALCQARAHTQAVALNYPQLNSGDATPANWWTCTGPLSAGLVGPNAVTSGSYALTIQPGTAFDVTGTNKVVSSAVGLSSGDQAKLVTAAQISSVLPSSQAVLP